MRTGLILGGTILMGTLQAEQVQRNAGSLFFFYTKERLEKGRL